MILALIALWALCCIIFFGSLAIAASQPLPPIDREALLSEPLSVDYGVETSIEPQFAYHTDAMEKASGLAH